MSISFLEGCVFGKLKEAARLSDISKSLNLEKENTVLEGKIKDKIASLIKEAKDLYESIEEEKKDIKNRDEKRDPRRKDYNW